MTTGFTALKAWQLHLQCAQARVNASIDRKDRALLAVEEALGAALTKILTPLADEEKQPETKP